MHAFNPYRPPQTAEPAAVDDDYPRDVWWLLFRFKGRIGRLTYWSALVVVGIIYLGAPSFLLPLLVTSESSECLVAAFLPLWIIPFGWVTLALHTKRWHDRDKAGYWTLIGFVPIVGPLWMCAELFLLPGTRGPNRFGPAPRW